MAQDTSSCYTTNACPAEILRYGSGHRNHPCEEGLLYYPTSLDSSDVPATPSPSIDSVLQEDSRHIVDDAPPKYVHSIGVLASSDQDLFPVHTVQATCCHCDNTQRLLEEWNPHTGEHRAVCEKCTWAFCLRCRIEPTMNIVIFRAGKAILPKLPSRDCQYMFIWLCSTCGRDEAIERHRVRQRSSFATVKVESFRCLHCAQNATRRCIFLAMAVYWETIDGVEDPKMEAWSSAQAETRSLVAEKEPPVPWNGLFKKLLRSPANAS